MSSPAVRDYLGLKQTDVTDWRFVDFSEVPLGHGQLWEKTTRLLSTVAKKV
jgi:hypothetical protein